MAPLLGLPMEKFKHPEPEACLARAAPADYEQDEALVQELCFERVPVSLCLVAWSEDYLWHWFLFPEEVKEAHGEVLEI